MVCIWELSDLSNYSYIQFLQNLGNIYTAFGINVDCYFVYNLKEFCSFLSFDVSTSILHDKYSHKILKTCNIEHIQHWRHNLLYNLWQKMGFLLYEWKQTEYDFFFKLS